MVGVLAFYIKYSEFAGTLFGSAPRRMKTFVDCVCIIYCGLMLVFGTMHITGHLLFASVRHHHMPVFFHSRVDLF